MIQTEKQGLVTLACRIFPDEPEIAACGKNKTRRQLLDWIMLKVRLQVGYAIIAGDETEADRLRAIREGIAETYFI